LYTPGIYTSVKTGTTNDVKDNWTIGYTHNVAVGVWVGNNNGDPMVHTSGLTGAAPIWNRVMVSIYGDMGLLAEFAVNGQLQSDQIRPPGDGITDDGMTLRQICNVRVLTDPSTNCPGTVTEWFLDSPAGVPDGQGGFYFPPPNNPAPASMPSSGAYIQEYGPGIFRARVFPLATDIANSIQFNVAPGQRPPPAPRYCRVTVELSASAAGAQDLLFITPPRAASDAAEAEEWARSHNLAFLPTIDCTPGLMSSTGTASGGSSGFPDPGGGIFPATQFAAYISSPQPYQVVTGAIPVMGTADFTSDRAQYYVLEIKGGPYGDWTRIQEPRYGGVVDGQLETLYAPAQAGNYLLRLLIVDWNGNIAQTPYVVPFVVP